MHRKKIDGAWITVKSDNDIEKYDEPIIPYWDQYDRTQRLKEYLYHLENPTYTDYLQTIHWHKIRKYMFDQPTSNKCIIKNCDNTDIVLHHTRYDRIGTNNEIYDLMYVCREHHNRIHGAVQLRYKCHEEEWSLFKITRKFVCEKNNEKFDYYLEENFDYLLEE